MILSINQTIGSRYKITSYIGAGGMQEVYKTYDQILEKHVALKTPKNDSAEKRFKRSAQCSAQVNHPHVAKTLDYLEEDGRPFLVEEFISGDDLGKLLKEKFYYFDPYLVAQLGHHLAKGLAASHHAGVIHRDLKPGNIIAEFREKRFSFKLTDFGIAKMVEKEFEEYGGSEDTITSSQTMMGAIPYMAPEMIKGVKYAGKFSDVWALGAILYRFLTGDYPFGKGLSAIPKINEAILPPSPAKFNYLVQFNWLVDEIWETIKLCLQKNPEGRPTSDVLAEKFSEICYSDCKRGCSTIRSFKDSYGDFGFISGSSKDYFFHRDSFYGDRTMIKRTRPVHFGLPYSDSDNRVHPVVPLKLAKDE